MQKDKLSNLIVKISKVIEDVLKDENVKIRVGQETGMLADDKTIYAKITFVGFGINDTKMTSVCDSTKNK